MKRDVLLLQNNRESSTAGGHMWWTDVSKSTRGGRGGSDCCQMCHERDITLGNMQQAVTVYQQCKTA
jgi:hypothetical protein